MTEAKKTEVKKATKKLCFTVLGCAAAFALLILLVTCSLFDEKTVGVAETDWAKIVKNSTWNYSSMNVGNKDSLIVALQTVKSVRFNDDYSATFEYSDPIGTSYYFSDGTLAFNNGSTGTMQVSQNSSKGLVANNITVSFSNQTDKQFDNKGYVMTFDVEGSGTIYFFIEK